MDTKIKVVGIGGSGGNAISRMKKCHLKNVELIAFNTDIQDLDRTRADLKFQIGQKITQGLGTGMNPEIGEKAAIESRDIILEALRNSDLIFITGGEGGGTFTGAAPIVAKIAKDLGALTIAVVTRPFSFEGRQRKLIAKIGLEKLKKNVDTLLIISNDKLLKASDDKTSVNKAFWKCDEILRQAVQGISDLICSPGIINVDFADIKTVMKDSGQAWFGIGRAKTAREAAVLAITSPLLGQRFEGARAVLFNVVGNEDLTLSQVNEVAQIITQKLQNQAKLIFGATEDRTLKKGEIKVTVIATF